METVACNLCGSERHTAVYAMPDRRYFREEFFTVVECDRCGLGFVNPRPTIAEMQKYYPAEYYQNPPTTSHDRYLTRRFTAQAGFLKELESGSGRRKLLDVGCANGDFPRFIAARGWEVEGVPMAYFRKASEVVKKGGLFVFLVPNFQSVASRYLFCEDIPRHLYFFTRETVRQYLEKTGFRLEKEDNGRSIYKLAPNNWLAFVLRTRLLGKKYSFEDVPLTSKEFRRVNHLRGGVVTALKYAAYSPASVIDRMLWPAIETGQMLRKTYGVSTYVGRKV